MLNLFNTALNQDEIEVVNRVLHSGQFVIGPHIAAFERDLSDYIGNTAVGCGSGTDALILALEEIPRINEYCVIVPAMTFSATAEAVIRVGAHPIVCDVDPDTLTPSLDDIKECYAEAIYQGLSVRAVILVHLYGWPASDTIAIAEFCKLHKLALIEDCCQAFGARLDGKPVGRFGDSAAFSFYPTKSLGGIGDAGAVSFCDQKANERAKAKRNHGRTDLGQLTPGYNSRIDEPNAALLTHRLARFEAENVARRREVSGRYHVNGLKKFSIERIGRGVPYVYPILVEDRDTIRMKLHDAGIQSGTHYDPPVSGLNYIRTMCPEADSAAKMILTLPCHHGLSLEDVDRIADAIR